MGFTLGGLDELADDEVRLLVAVDADRTVHGVTSWLPVRRDGVTVGWTLDFMRRRGEGFRGGDGVPHRVRGAARAGRRRGVPLAVRRAAGPAGPRRAGRRVAAAARRGRPVAGAGVRVPVAAGVQGQVPAGVPAAVPGLPGPGRAAADRGRDRPRLPARRRARASSAGWSAGWCGERGSAPGPVSLLDVSLLARAGAVGAGRPRAWRPGSCCSPGGAALVDPRRCRRRCWRPGSAAALVALLVDRVWRPFPDPLPLAVVLGAGRGAGGGRAGRGRVPGAGAGGAGWARWSRCWSSWPWRRSR